MLAWQNAMVVRQRVVRYLNLTLLCYNCYGGAFINKDCAFKHGNGKCILIIRTCFLSFFPRKTQRVCFHWIWTSWGEFRRMSLHFHFNWLQWGCSLSDTVIVTCSVYLGVLCFVWIWLHGVFVCATRCVCVCVAQFAILQLKRYFVTFGQC